MKALIVGLGSIGRRHLANLRLIEPKTQIIIWRQHSAPQQSDDICGKANEIVYDLKAALETKPDVAFITNPASFHVETALSLAKQNIHLFIEKPLSNTLDKVDELLDLCSEYSLVVMVGYNFRFNKSLHVMRQTLLEGRIGRPLSIRAEVGQYLPEWRPNIDYRKSVSARRDLGGGVVLELSHELDYVRWLMGEVKSIRGYVGRLSDFEIDVEDTAEILLHFQSGVIGNIHMNMCQRNAMRNCRIIGTLGTLMWDGLSNRVQIYLPEVGKWADIYASEAVDQNEMYVSEIRHFLECVKTNSTPMVSGLEGRRVLEMALAVKESSSQQELVEL